MGLTLEQKVEQGLILSPSTEPVYVGYKEPLQAVQDGFGYKGVLSTNQDKTHVQCHLCGFYYKHLGIHVAKFHKIPQKIYKKEYGLAAQTSLVSDRTRDVLIAASEKVPRRVKRKRLKALAAGRKIRASLENQFKGKALETKNKEGRCPDQLIDKINKLAETLERTPSQREFRKHYGGYVGSIYLSFGSWSNAVKIAGLMPARVGLPQTYTPEALIAILKDFKQKHKREPSSSDMRNDYMPSQWTFVKYFGSWKNAKKAAFKH